MDMSLMEKLIYEKNLDSCKQNKGRRALFSWRARYDVIWVFKLHYNNNVHFEGVRFICGPHLAIIGPSEARADLMTR